MRKISLAQNVLHAPYAMYFPLGNVYSRERNDKEETVKA